ncbi:MAG TPA: lycopene cyclase domain-containing protein [Candidatus Saccharimonadales bacterium]|nr:lycopene cyclase domain-containing protein [Candidatus Saccharimonadales bacterium]
MAHYPYYYLAYSLLFLVTLTFILLKRKDLRRPALYLAALGAVLNPLSELLYYRDYWQPDNLLGRGRVSIEDVIFGASMYALAVVIYPFLTGKRLPKAKPALQQTQLLHAGGYIVAVAGLTVGGNLWLGINSVIATGAACMLVTVATWVKRRDVMVPSLITGVVSIVVVTAGYVLGLDVIAPHLLQSWWLLQGTPLGITFLGNVPLTELLWFFGVSNFFASTYMSVTAQHYVAGRRPLLWRLHLPRSTPQPINSYIYREQGID